MKRSLLITLVLATGCSSNDAGDGASPGGTPSGATFQLAGTVSNTFSSVQNGRLVVGVAHASDVKTQISCDRFIVHQDGLQNLPAHYELVGIPQGNYVLVGALIDSSTPQAPAGLYPITVDGEGVHAGSQITVTTLNIAFQGTMSYQCP